MTVPAGSDDIRVGDHVRVKRLDHVEHPDSTGIVSGIYMGTTQHDANIRSLSNPYAALSRFHKDPEPWSEPRIYWLDELELV